MLTLDGYGSHLNVPSALRVLHEHKIHVIKEEGDASDTNEAYDANVAKADKLRFGGCLTLFGQS